MARKSRKKEVRRSTRRRGGIGKISAGGTVMNIVGVLGGVAVAGYLNKFLFTPKDGQALSPTQETLGKYAPLALGIITPLVLKSDLGKNLGAGMIAYGGAKILQGAGLGNVFGEDAEVISIGTDSLPALAGYSDSDYAVAGYSDSDYAVAGTIPVLAGLGLEEMN